MAYNINDLGRSIFASCEPAKSVDDAVLQLREWNRLVQALLNSKDAKPQRLVKERAARLAEQINVQGKNTPFVQEVEKLSLKELVYYAKSYHVGTMSGFKAEYLSAFLKAQGLEGIDEEARKYVKSGAERIGGRFWDIYNNAEQNDGRSLAESGTTASSLGSYLTTLPLFTKKFAQPLFHKDTIEMMQKDKSWGGNADIACNVKMHLHTQMSELHIDVPIGVAPQRIKVFPENDAWGTFHYETHDRIVIFTNDPRIMKGLASSSMGFQLSS